MPLDPSIPLQAGRGVTPLKDQNEIADAQYTRQMRQLQMQQAQRSMADDQAYRQVLQSGLTGDDQVSALQRAGLGKQAMEAQKFQMEQQKSRMEQGKAVGEALKSGATAVMANPTEQNAIQMIDGVASMYKLDPKMFDQGKARIYAARNDPAQLRQLMMELGAKAEEALGKLQSVNLGGSMQTQRVNPVTGQVEVLASQDKTTSPDAMLQAQTSTQNNLRTVGATMRGQDLRDTQEAAKLTQKNAVKPLSPTALKMQQESLDAIGTASSINADLGAMAKQIEDGKLTFGPVSNLYNRARNATGTSTEESRNFASFQSTLEKLRNDSLRLNKGVQTEGDAQRAWNELIANINDPKLVQQRLKEVQALNERAVQLRKLDIDTIRSNFQQEPMDYSKFTNQPAAVGQKQEGPKPKVKTMNIGGIDMKAELAPDGNYYIQNGGKWFRVKD